MAIRQSSLVEYSERVALQKSFTLTEAASQNKPTAFLSHSHKDGRLAKGVQGYLNDKGWDVYIDWEDASMPETPNAATADNIKKRIKAMDWFLFLATDASMKSRWCPWEIGYADGVKKREAIQIISTMDSFGVTHGNEYLKLYNHIDIASTGTIGSFGFDNKGYLLQGRRLP